MKRLTACVLGFAICTAANADSVPAKVKSAAYVEMIAQRGLECAHLKRWQSLSLRALSLVDRNGWSAKDLDQLRAETARMIDETACDAERLTVWIEGARDGFELEMLPPYLVAYQTLAEMDAPPMVFSATTLRLDQAPLLAAIETKLAELEASGRLAEGGKTWPVYIDDTSSAVRGFVDQLGTEGGDQAAALIAQSALIVGVWYLEETQ